MAGRKPKPEDMRKVKMTITVKPETRAYLNKASERTGNNVSQLVEDIISKSMVDKEYIEREYRQAMLEFKTAHNEDEQWQARNTMARLEHIAMLGYGFAYADELHQKIINPKKEG